MSLVSARFRHGVLVASWQSPCALQVVVVVLVAVVVMGDPGRPDGRSGRHMIFVCSIVVQESIYAGKMVQCGNVVGPISIHPHWLLST